MFVGEAGVQRVVQRSAELMKQDKNEDARAQGGVDLPTIQKYLNLWYSLSLDLFGSEISTNAASFFASGLKGRAKEEKFPDHVALEGTYGMEVLENGKMVHQDVPMRSAMNEVLRDGYVDDCQRGVDRWNKVLNDRGINFKLELPSRRFHRHQGIFQEHAFDPKGNLISKEEFEKRKDEWLPSAADKTYVKSLQSKAVTEPGKMQNWVAAPPRGVNNKPVDYEYVRGDV